MAVAASNKRVLKSPYVMASQLVTTADGTQINGGAVAAGTTRNFPENAFLNALSIPFWVTHVQVKVTRGAGGGDTDSDYDFVSMEFKDLVRSLEMTKDPIPLSVLCDRWQRRWLIGGFAMAQWVIRRQGGGITVRCTALSGAIGAPYNLSIAFHGYLEEDVDAPPSYMPSDRL